MEDYDDNECPDLSVYVLLHPQGKKVLKELKYDPARDWSLPVSSLRAVGSLVMDGVEWDDQKKKEQEGNEGQGGGSGATRYGRWELVPSRHHGCYGEGEEGEKEELNRAVMDAVRRNGWGHVVERGPRWDQFKRFGVLERSSNKEVALEYVRRIQEEGEWALLADLATMLYERFALARDAMVILRSDPDIGRLRDLFLDEEAGLGADAAVARILRGGGAPHGGGGGGGGGASSSHLVSGGSSVQYMSMRFPPPVLNVIHSYPHLIASSSCSSTPEMCADLLEFMARLKTGVANVLREWERGCVFQGFKPGGGDWGVYFAHKEDGREEQDPVITSEQSDADEEVVVKEGSKRRNKKKKGTTMTTKGGKRKETKAKSGHEHLRAQCMMHVETVNRMVCDMLKLVRKSCFVIPELAKILVRVAEDRAVVMIPDYNEDEDAVEEGKEKMKKAQSHPKRGQPPLVAVYRCSFRWTFMCLLTERAQTLTGGVVPTFKDVYDLFVEAEAEAGRRSVVAAAAQETSLAAGKRDGTVARKRTRGGWRGFGGYADPMEVLLFEGPCRRGAPRDYYKGWKAQPENMVRAPRRKRSSSGGQKAKQPPADRS